MVGQQEAGISRKRLMANRDTATYGEICAEGRKVLRYTEVGAVGIAYRVVIIAWRNYSERRNAAMSAFSRCVKFMSKRVS